MLRASLLFFGLGVFCIVLGAHGFAGMTFDIGRMLLGVFLILTGISFVISMVSGKSPQLASIVALVAILGTTDFSFADEPVSKKVAEAANDSRRAVKKTYRKVKDETCSLTKGKMECAGDKVKHSVQNGTDTIEDAVE